MSAVTRRSVLPPVLQQYEPEYEPRDSTAADKSLKSAHNKSHDQSRQRGEASAVRAEKGETSHREQKAEASNSRPKEKTWMTRRPSRETTFETQKRKDVERFNRNYDNWQTAKAEVREQNYQQLRDKVSLQKQLIRSQDDFFQQKRQEHDEQGAQKREDEKRKKQAQAEALREICRQSLDHDREKLAARHQAREHKKTAAQKKQLSFSEKQTSQVGSETDVYTDSEPQTTRQATMMSDISELSSISAEPPVRERTMASMHEDMFADVQEEEEEEDGDVFNIEADNKHVPWHHRQLYRMYGQDADYFLHPKVDEEEQKVVRPMNPRIRRQGGRAGASQLWSTLREDSKLKLLREDSKFPRELKSAYGAFVRQLLARREHPVKRNFYAEEDVPEMQRLIDQSRVQEAKKFRHKIEIMFRSSQINKDRSNILLFNNPLPDVNNAEGEESVNRYMPSWMEEQDEDSVEGYKRWIRVHKSSPTSAETKAPIDAQENMEPEPAATKDDGNEWDFLLAQKKQKKKKKKQKAASATLR